MERVAFFDMSDLDVFFMKHFNVNILYQYGALRQHERIKHCQSIFLWQGSPLVSNRSLLSFCDKALGFFWILFWACQRGWIQVSAVIFLRSFCANACLKRWWAKTLEMSFSRVSSFHCPCFPQKTCLMTSWWRQTCLVFTPLWWRSSWLVDVHSLLRDWEPNH